MSRQVLGDRFGNYGMELDEVIRQMLDIYLTGIGVGSISA